MTNGLGVIACDKELNLQEFVRNATWRELLIELVDTNRLDPWDIDIVKIVDSYIAAVRKMQVMDLHIPANIILAASILLRMKSETINVFQSDESAPPDEEPMQSAGRVMPDVPQLIPRLRLQPKRRITLDELMDALGDAIKINGRRETAMRQRTEPLSFPVENDDIDEKMDATYRLVKANVDKEGLITFANLSKGFGTIEGMLLNLFVPLLFLAHKEQVTLMQDEFFNEIFVKLNDGCNGVKGK